MPVPDQMRLGENAPVGDLPAVDLQIANDRGFGATSGAVSVTSGNKGGFVLWNGSTSEWVLVYGMQISVSAAATAQVAGVSADPALGTAVTAQPKRKRTSGESAQAAAVTVESSANVGSAPTAITDTFLLQPGVYSVPNLAVDTVLPPQTGLEVYLSATGAFSFACNIDWLELAVTGA